MNKVVVVAAAVLMILTAVTWAVLRFGVGSRPLSKYSLILTNVPQNYCPQLAWVTVFKDVSFGESTAGEGVAVDEGVAVTDCQIINLADYRAHLEDAGSVVILKLPQALAFKVPKLFKAKAVIEYGVPLGDVTADNAIDNLDLDLIQENLFRRSVERPDVIDIDGDGQITVLDFSRSLINRGVGASRPDGNIWPEAVR